MPSAELYATLDLFDTHWKAIKNLGEKHNALVEEVSQLYNYISEQLVPYLTSLEARIVELEKGKINESA